jgi:hypothetical protein
MGALASYAGRSLFVVPYRLLAVVVVVEARTCRHRLRRYLVVSVHHHCRRHHVHVNYLRPAVLELVVLLLVVLALVLALALLLLLLLLLVAAEGAAASNKLFDPISLQQYHLYVHFRRGQFC